MLRADAELTSITWVFQGPKVCGFIQQITDGNMAYDACRIDKDRVMQLAGNVTRNEAVSALVA